VPPIGVRSEMEARRAHVVGSERRSSLGETKKESSEAHRLGPRAGHWRAQQLRPLAVGWADAGITRVLPRQPSGLVARLVGLVAGGLLLSVRNVGPVLALLFVSSRYPQSYEFVHVLLWQTHMEGGLFLSNRLSKQS
jgi:hypothetical protein